MEIKFTKKQYEQLAKLVYLGNWMANAVEDSSLSKKKLQEFDDLESYIFSFAEKFGFDDWASYDEEDKIHFPTSMFEDQEDINVIMREYDNDNFWQELIDRLTARDFARTYGEEAGSKMDWEERFKKLFPLQEKWGKEFENHGIDHLEIKH